jgi:hypothetical protein
MPSVSGAIDSSRRIAQIALAQRERRPEVEMETLWQTKI